MACRRAASAVVLLALVLAGCGPASSGRPAATTAQETIRVASYDFSANQILAEVYVEAIRRAGLPVQVQHGVGTREVVEPALEQGVVDVVVDYLGTAVQFVDPGDPVRGRSPDQLHATLAQAMGGRGVAVFTAAGAEDQNGFVITAAFRSLGFAAARRARLGQRPHQHRRPAPAERGRRCRGPHAGRGRCPLVVRMTHGRWHRASDASQKGRARCKP